MTSKNEPKSEKELQETAETEETLEYVDELPKIQVERRNNSKYEKKFAAIPESRLLKITGRKEISRHFRALKRLQKRGKFTNLKSHTRTIDGETCGFIGAKEEKE
jgi:hypothetical protein